MLNNRRPPATLDYETPGKPRSLSDKLRRTFLVYVGVGIALLIADRVAMQFSGYKLPPLIPRHPTTFQIANLCEAALWSAISAAFAVAAVRRHGPARRTAFFVAATFLLFAMSDLIETHTGAWWRPWWLLAWKAACILILLALYIHRRRLRLTSHPVHARICFTTFPSTSVRRKSRPW